ncbi:MAG: GTP-binding protein [Candidatus Lokiarchaeota archaeon]|nr:GTP-binding protein [Candidatus Lokiarchaeota archaeon]
MLRQTYILKGDQIIYEKNFGKALSEDRIHIIFQEISKESFRGLSSDFGVYSYFKYKILYQYEIKLNLLFIFITGLNDETKKSKKELIKFKNEFIFTFGDKIDNIELSLLEILNPLVYNIHKTLKTKISLIGFSGVGKTTTTNLIRSTEIPTVHIPTITGKISNVKIGRLFFYLWDFAGQEQFSYLWNDFIVGSDAVLIITDSTLENVEKSRFFIELIKQSAPYAHIAVIGNKQDQSSALDVERIEKILGIKTYKMIAIDPNNRVKMIQIIADILEISTNESPLLKPLFERDDLITKAQKCLENNDLAKASEYFKQISTLCFELGDYSLYREFNEKSEKLELILKK